MEDGAELRDQNGSEEQGRQDPAEAALEDPIDLPGPAANAAEGEVAACGRETACPVIKDA